MAISKVSTFDRATEGLGCQHIYHPGESCAQMWWATFVYSAPAAGTLMAPIIMISLARKWRTLTTTDLKTLFYQWLSMSGTLCTASIISHMLFCGFRKLLGKFNRFTILAIPAGLGNLSSFLLNDRDANIFANTNVMMMLESFFRSDDTGVFTVIRNSIAARTLVFMTLSALAMDLCKVMPEVHSIWISQPPRLSKTINSDDGLQVKVDSLESPFFDRLIGGHHFCLHSNTCDNYILAAIKEYFQLGVGIEMARIVLGNFKLLYSSPMKLSRIFIDRINLRLVCFMVGYNALYRLINCLLNRHSQQDSRAANWLAAFWGGCAFYVHPNLTLLSHASVAVGRLLWSRHYQQLALLQAIHKLPIAKLMWAFSSGCIFYIRTFQPFICPSFLMKATNYTSGYRLENQILKNFYRHYLGFDE